MEAQRWLRDRHAESGASRKWFSRLVSATAILLVIVAIIQPYRELPSEQSRHHMTQRAHHWDASVDNLAMTQDPLSLPPLLALRDASERDAAVKEFSAIVDHQSLTKTEMPAYWRLVRWSNKDSLETLKEHGRCDIRFADFFENPAEFRGMPVQLQLRLTRSLWHLPAPDNPAGVSRVFEGWGATVESGANPYCVVFTEPPNGMLLGSNIRADATFYGYFLKVLAYQEEGGRRLESPLLIGQLDWHPPQSAFEAFFPFFPFWPTTVGGILFLLACLFMIQRGEQRKLARLNLNARSIEPGAEPQAIRTFDGLSPD